jgi:hypothetical protein
MPVGLSPEAALRIEPKLAAISISYRIMSISALPTTSGDAADYLLNRRLISAKRPSICRSVLLHVSIAAGSRQTLPLAPRPVFAVETKEKGVTTKFSIF